MYPTSTIGCPSRVNPRWVGEGAHFRCGHRESHHDRDVLDLGYLELADLRRRVDGAGTHCARGFPVLARARSAAGRASVVRDPSVLAVADPDVRDLRSRRGAAVAARRA